MVVALPIDSINRFIADLLLMGMKCRPLPSFHPSQQTDGLVSLESYKRGKIQASLRSIPNRRIKGMVNVTDLPISKSVPIIDI